MADNTQLNTGTGGDVISTDDLGGGVKVQRVKVQFGADGAATDVSSNDPLPIEGEIALDSATLAALETVTAELSATDNAVLDAIATLLAGTLTVDLGATDNAVLDSIATLLGTIDADTSALAAIIAGSELQVDIVASLPAGTNAIGKLAANSGVDIGDVDVLSIAAGNNLIGNVGISGARTAGGTTFYKNLDVDESEDQIKGTPGQVYWVHAMNLTAAKLYLKFYNATAANVTVGTTVPVLTFVLPTTGDTSGAGFVLAIPNGIAFGTAITIACTTGLADNDTGAPGANSCVVNIGYA